MKIHHIIQSLVIITVIIMISIPVSAQYYAPSAESDYKGFTFEVTPYLWTFGLNGTVKLGNSPKISVDADFGDVLDNLEAGGAIALEMRINRFFTSYEYSKLELGHEVYLDGTRVDLDIDYQMSSIQAGYRIGKHHFLDVYAGARYFASDAAINVWGGRDFGDREEWVDPFVGSRLIIKPAQRVKLILVSDIGGFGVGSDLSWQIMPLVKYEFPEVFSLSLGYRYMDVDYDDDDFLYDMETHGWVFGAGFRF